MQLTMFTDYGLRSLMYLASRPDQLCSVGEIAQRYGISRNHLVKVVHRLAQLGYIASTKGKGGGIRLACDPKEVRLGDLIEELEPNMHIVECFDRDTNSCLIIDACRLKRYLHEATRSFLDNLNQHTLADAAGNRAIFKALNEIRPS
ncbi:Rrf2 family transcriptional regulator [Methyloligella solikamskensis]|uniref:Rrf2 family transcriptional regulator n=1 Tax=Methyloligella solikamskensis TaxID=1177756 RepID=A0ABW3J814_9HYPH